MHPGAIVSSSGGTNEAETSRLKEGGLDAERGKAKKGVITK